MDNSIYVIVYNINTNYTSFEDIYFKSLDETIKYMTKLCETFFDKLYTKNVKFDEKSLNDKNIENIIELWNNSVDSLIFMEYSAVGDIINCNCEYDDIYKKFKKITYKKFTFPTIM